MSRKPEQAFIYQTKHGVPHQIIKWPRIIGIVNALYAPAGYRLVGMLRIRWKIKVG